jgi:hypothetical protein
MRSNDYPALLYDLAEFGLPAFFTMVVEFNGSTVVKFRAELYDFAVVGLLLIGVISLRLIFPSMKSTIVWLTASGCGKYPSASLEKISTSLHQISNDPILLP